MRETYVLIILAILDDVFGNCWMEKTPLKTFRYIGRSKRDINESMNSKICLDICINLGNEYTIAGLTNGRVCLCGKTGEDSTLVTKSNSLCDTPCPNGDPCGSKRGYYSIYKRDPTPNYNLTLEDSKSANSLSIKIETTPKPLPSGIELFWRTDRFKKFVKFDKSQNSIKFEENGKFSLFHGVKNTILFEIRDINGTSLFSKSHTFEFTPTEKFHKVEQVFCPPVAIPNLAYTCSIIGSVSFSSGNKIKFDAKVGSSSIVSKTLDLEYTKPFVIGDVSPILKISEVTSKNPWSPEATKVYVIPQLGPMKESIVFDKLVYWAKGWNTNSKLFLHLLQAKCDSGFHFDPKSGFCELKLEDQTEFIKSIPNYSEITNLVCKVTDFFNVLRGVCQKGGTTSCSNQFKCQSNLNPKIPSSFKEVEKYELTTEYPSGKSEGITISSFSTHQIILKYGHHIGIECNPCNSGFAIAQQETKDKRFHVVTKEGIRSNKRILMTLLANSQNAQKIEVTCTESSKELTYEAIPVSGKYASKKAQNTTQCQYPIKDASFDLKGSITPQDRWGSSDDTNYFRTDEDITLTVNTSQGDPINYTINWGDGSELVKLLDQNGAVRSKTFTKKIIDDGKKEFNFTMENDHSYASKLGAIGYVHNFSKTLKLYHPVVDTWEYVSKGFWFDSAGDYCFAWKIPDISLKKPTEPKMKCDWGDGENIDEEIKGWNLKDGSTDTYCFNHTYKTSGIFNVNCTMYNKLSKKTFLKNVTIYQEIMNLKALLRYAKPGEDQDKAKLHKGTGAKFNEIPLGQNVTLMFTYDKGTIERLIFENITDPLNPIMLKNITPPNPFNVKDLRVHLTFPEEGEFNLSVKAENNIQKYNLSIINLIMAGKIQGMSINDFNKRTGKDEVKKFELKFESIGGGTCVIVDFDDGYINAYGDKSFCSTYAPKNIPFIEKQITSSTEITHKYL